MTNPLWQAQFLSRANWLYTLERSTNLQNWATAAQTLPGTGTNLILTDTNVVVPQSYYRVRADRP